MLYFTTLLISFFITITLIPLLRRAAIRLHSVDYPNERKVHTAPIPKCGGLGMALGTMIPIALLSGDSRQLASILAGSVIIVIFGLLDDFRDISYKLKFSGQIVAAFLVILWGGVSINSLGMLLPGNIVLPGYMAIPLTLFVVVGVTNAINLSDGLDGLAGGISMLGFALIGYLAFVSGDHPITLTCFAMVGAIFGFLRFNSHPARLFMGDAGSQLLGFLTITMSLALTQGGGAYNVTLPLMIAGYPVLDTLRVMIIRIMGGRNPFSADKNHLHHRLMGLGFQHAETVFFIYLFQTSLIITGYLLRYFSGWWSLAYYLILSSVTLSFLALAERTGWNRKRKEMRVSAVKTRIKNILFDRKIAIRIFFGALKYPLPIMFFMSCVMPREVPFYLGFSTLTLAAVLVLLLLYKNAWVEAFIRLSLYLTIPFILFYGETDRSGLFNPLFIRIYELFLVGLVVPAGLTMRFTARKRGFKTSPMDFLIFFIALAIALVPDFSDMPDTMRFMATKMMVLFFSYEVLIGELRGKVEALGWFTAGSLITLSLF